MSMLFQGTRTKVVLSAIAWAGLLVEASLAADGPGPACLADRSHVAYELQYSTSQGGLHLKNRRQGDTITVEGLWANGRTFRILRRNGFDLTTEAGSHRTEISYPEGLTNAPVTVTKPDRFQRTEASTSSGVLQKADRSVIELAYLGEERVRVGDCSFDTVHFSEGSQVQGVPSAYLTTQRWFSPGLNVDLRRTIERREADGTTKEVFTAEATSVRVRTPGDD